MPGLTRGAGRAKPAAMSRISIALGALAGGLVVGLSAWAAHAPGAASPERARLIASALQIQGWHALALVSAGLLAERRSNRLPLVAAACFAGGMLLFCGAVWWIALGNRSLGPVAPVGGTLLMLGWAALAAGALRR